MFDDPSRPDDASPTLPRPIFEESTEASPFESAPAAFASSSPEQQVLPSADATGKQELPEEAGVGGGAPDLPTALYAPPPSGSQYSAPPPPGVVHTPPAPGVALHPSALPLPPGPPSLVQPSLVQPSLVQPSLVQPSLVAPSLVQPSPVQPSPGTSVDPQPAPVPRSQLELPGSGTLGVWMLAALPFLQFAVVYAVFGVLALPLVPGIQWGILAVPAIFSLLFAAADRKKLLDNGHDEAPNSVFGILAPLYLIVRVAMIGPKSIAPLVVWIVLQAAEVAGVLVLLPAVLAAAISGS
jgi:hypothetical protein